jgi:hypothetical protein
MSRRRNLSVVFRTARDRNLDTRPHFQDMNMMGEPISRAPVSRSEPSTSVRSGKGRLLVTRCGSPFVTLAEDFEQHFGARPGQRHEPEFIHDQQFLPRQVLLTAQQPRDTNWSETESGRGSSRGSSRSAWPFTRDLAVGRAGDSKLDKGRGIGEGFRQGLFRLFIHADRFELVDDRVAREDFGAAGG